MARNTRPTPPSKAARVSTSAQLPSCVDSASPSQLQAWLKNPPSADVARAWRLAPWPLKRAVEIEHRALFREWCAWGCSPTAQFSHLSTSHSLVKSLSPANRHRMLQWVLEDDPQDFSLLLSQLRACGETKALRELDWSRILGSPHLDDRTAQRMAAEALLGAEGVLPLGACLQRSGGRLGSGYAVRDVIVGQRTSIQGVFYTGNVRSISIPMESRVDQAIALRVAALPEGVSLDLAPGQLAVLGGFYSAAALSRAIHAGRVTAPMTRATCRDYEMLFMAWSEAFKTTPSKPDKDALMVLVNDLLPCVDWRKSDDQKRSPLHAVNLPSWPEEVVVQVLDMLVELRPAVLSQKDKQGNVPAQSPSLKPFAQDWLASYERRRQLNQTLRHQVAQTQAVKEAIGRPSSPTPPAPRRM